MFQDLVGKRALVTGGAQGIGLAIASKLAEEGANVGILDINYGQASSVAAAKNDILQASGNSGRIHAFQADVTDEDSVEGAIESFVALHGGVDVLVNNAGITRDNLLFRMSRQDWDSVIQTNLTSMFVVTRIVQRHMVDAKFGKIVNISSQSALGNRGQSNYAAAKAGVQGFTATLAVVPSEVVNTI